MVGGKLNNKLKVKLANSIDRNNCFYFSSNQLQKNKYQKQIEKYNYISSQTQGVESLGTVSLFTALLLGAQNADLSKKLPRAQKIGIAALLLSFGSLIVSSIKKYKLSKEYDKENA